MSILGPISGPNTVRDAVLELLQKWYDSHMVETDRAEGNLPGHTATARSWQTPPIFDNTLARQLPALFVMCPGTAAPPIKEGNGAYRVTYTLGVAALVMGPTQHDSQTVAALHGDVIKEIMLQHPEELPQIHGISWQSETLDDVSVESSQTLTSVIQHFDIEFKNVINSREGPKAPILGEESPYKNPLENPEIEQYPNWGIIPDENHIKVILVPKKVNQKVSGS